LRERRQAARGGGGARQRSGRAGVVELSVFKVERENKNGKTRNVYLEIFVDILSNNIAFYL
jgi:hypothetical protein